MPTEFMTIEACSDGGCCCIMPNATCTYRPAVPYALPERFEYDVRHADTAWIVVVCSGAYGPVTTIVPITLAPDGSGFGYIAIQTGCMYTIHALNECGEVTAKCIDCGCSHGYDAVKCTIWWNCDSLTTHAILRRVQGLGLITVAIGKTGEYPVWLGSNYVLSIYCDDLSSPSSEIHISTPPLSVDSPCLEDCTYYDECAEEFRTIKVNSRTCEVCGCHRGGLIYGELVVSGLPAISTGTFGIPGFTYVRTFTGLDQANGTYIWHLNYDDDLNFCRFTPQGVLVGTVVESIVHDEPSQSHLDSVNEWDLWVYPSSSNILILPRPGNTLGPGTSVLGSQASSVAYPATDEHCAYNAVVRNGDSWFGGHGLSVHLKNIMYVENPVCL